MSSIDINIIHDHVYSFNGSVEKDCNPERGTSNNNDDRRRIIRKKSDIQTEDDQQEYFRRRTLNNASCRISRLHRRSKVHSIWEKCKEYEDLNSKLNVQVTVLLEVINQLKEDLHALVSHQIKSN